MRMRFFHTTVLGISFSWNYELGKFGTTFSRTVLMKIFAGVTWALF